MCVLCAAHHGMRYRFYFVEESRDEDGHLNDVCGDDLPCTDSFDTVEQVSLCLSICLESLNVCVVVYHVTGSV